MFGKMNLSNCWVLANAQGLAAGLFAYAVLSARLPGATAAVLGLALYVALSIWAFDGCLKARARKAAGAASASAPKPAAKPPVKPAPQPVAALKAPEPVAALPKQSRPALLAAARGGVSDDLKRIKGIGPKLEAMLHGMGVHHFDQIASWTEAELAWVDDNLEGFKGRASRDAWVDQAKVLAAGGVTEFAQRVDAGEVPTSQA